MSILSLQHVQLSRHGSILSLELVEGDILVVAGTPSSGKSSFLKLLSGQGHPVAGEVKVNGRVGVFEGQHPRKPTQKVSLILNGLKGAKPDRVAEALYATNLWPVKDLGFHELSESQIYAFNVACGLAIESDLMVIDGHLDFLDDYCIESVWSAIYARLKRGAALALATNRLQFVHEADIVIVMQAQQVRFSGTVKELLRMAPPQQLAVRTENRKGVRALCDPFEVVVRETDEGVMLHTTQGQRVAANLLAAGYNDVQMIVQKAPTPADAIMTILRQNR